MRAHTILFALSWTSLGALVTSGCGDDEASGSGGDVQACFAVSVGGMRKCAPSKEAMKRYAVTSRHGLEQ